MGLKTSTSRAYGCFVLAARWSWIAVIFADGMVCFAFYYLYGDEGALPRPAIYSLLCLFISSILWIGATTAIGVFLGLSAVAVAAVDPPEV